jgi:DNA polymerase III beta subunit, central domain
MTAKNEVAEIKNLVEVPVADLLRVTPFKGDDDIRYYLNGVLVTPHDGGALLVATNGHWMAVYESKAARVDKPRILDLPKWFVNQMQRVERGEGLDDEPVEWDDEDGPAPRGGPKTLIVATETSHLTIHEHGVEQLVKPALPFIDGKFPDWQEVIPDPSTLERGLFSAFAPNYFAELYKAVPDQGEHPLFCYQSRAGGPGVFRFGGMPGLVALLMPRTDDDKEVKGWPAWMQKEPQS